MHPQRIEALFAAFSEPCDIVLHSFFEACDTLTPYPKIDQFTVLRNELRQCHTGCIYLDHRAHIHHSQPTVRKDIFIQSPFSELKEDEVKEDCVFCHRILSIPGVQTGYLAHPLSKYIPSLTMAAYKEGN
jgi:hypothetical protein